VQHKAVEKQKVQEGKQKEEKAPAMTTKAEHVGSKASAPAAGAGAGAGSKSSTQVIADHAAEELSHYQERAKSMRVDTLVSQQTATTTREPSHVLVGWLVSSRLMVAVVIVVMVVHCWVFSRICSQDD
jgi:cobalamin biosynthesis Mg chelatase CobN